MLIFLDLQSENREEINKYVSGFCNQHDVNLGAGEYDKEDFQVSSKWIRWRFI